MHNFPSPLVKQDSETRIIIWTSNLAAYSVTWFEQGRYHEDNDVRTSVSVDPCFQILLLNFYLNTSTVSVPYVQPWKYLLKECPTYWPLWKSCMPNPQPIVDPVSQTLFLKPVHIFSYLSYHAILSLLNSREVWPMQQSSLASQPPTRAGCCACPNSLWNMQNRSGNPLLSIFRESYSHILILHTQPALAWSFWPLSCAKPGISR